MPRQCQYWFDSYGLVESTFSNLKISMVVIFNFEKIKGSKNNLFFTNVALLTVRPMTLDRALI